MNTVRTEEQLSLMRESGRICALALKTVLASVKPGVTTLELDKIAEDEIKRLGGESSFKTVEEYPYTICVSVNDDVVHGLPTDYALQSGDKIGIDIGALYNGWHSDLAESVLVDEQGASEETKKFLATGKQALLTAIDQARVGNKVGDISAAMQQIVEKEGYSVVRALTGHGVGTQLHEEPMIPCFGKKGKGETLLKNMTIAIEVIYNMGSYDVRWKNQDGWTISTYDGKLSGLFERTVHITESDAEILTPIDTI